MVLTHSATSDSSFLDTFGHMEAPDSTALDVKLHSKSISNDFRDIQNRVKIGSGMLLGRNMARKSIVKTSSEFWRRPWHVPESPQRRIRIPKRAPGKVREHAEETKIDAALLPETKKSMFFHAARSRLIVGAIFR